jgi:hypothetical protein
MPDVPEQRGSHHDDYDVPGQRRGTHDQQGYGGETSPSRPRGGGGGGGMPPRNRSGCDMVLIPVAAALVAATAMLVKRIGK